MYWLRWQVPTFIKTKAEPPWIPRWRNLLASLYTELSHSFAWLAFILKLRPWMGHFLFPVFASVACLQGTEQNLLELITCQLIMMAVTLYQSMHDSCFVEYGGHLIHDIAYICRWTFALIMIYFALGSIVSAYGCWYYLKRPENGAEEAEYVKRDLEEGMSTHSITYKEKETMGSIKLQSRYAEEEFQQRAGFWGYLMQTIHQTCAGAVILTDIAFWCVIVPFLTIDHLNLNPVMDCMHSVNIVLLLVDTALNNLPFPWFRFAYFVLWSCIYVIFQWVIHACGLSWWPYPFLVLNTPLAPVWYFCLAVAHMPCYGLYALIVKAKNKILARLFPNALLRPY